MKYTPFHCPTADYRPEEFSLHVLHPELNHLGSSLTSQDLAFSCTINICHCGSNGFSTHTKDCIQLINTLVNIFLYGQERNPQTWATACTDMLILKPDAKDAENNHSFSQRLSQRGYKSSKLSSNCPSWSAMKTLKGESTNHAIEMRHPEKTRRCRPC
jgi:hypothetical protein